MNTQSQKYQFNQEDAIKIGRVFVWLLASTTISFLLTVLPQIDFGNFMYLVPVINVILVSAQKFVKDQNYAK